MDAGLVILDGWGLNPDTEARDAVAAAETPQFDSLCEVGASATLRTDGPRVGLPPGQMGNSEVGHLTIGAGRAVVQESVRIADAIARWREEEGTLESTDPPLDENPALDSAFEHARERGGQVHLLGLVSDGGVHAAQEHLHALVSLAAERGVEAVTHAFTDGRDTAPTAGVDYLETLSAHTGRCDTGDVATVSGRYYAMDRDENWDRTRCAYDAVVAGESEHTVSSAVAAVQAAHERGETDEFVVPTRVEDAPVLTDGDAAVFVNFRADRARQLTRMLCDIDPVWPFETDPPAVRLVTMTEYDEEFDLPVAFPPREPGVTLGSVLAETGHDQLRLAETEKYAHVTYFLNGGREAVFTGEHREILPSPDVPTYDEQPAMSAAAVTDRALERLDDADVFVLNYANPDMVGHTGEFDAAVAAVETVDEQLRRLRTALQEAGAHLLVLADHGNAEEMGTPAAPHTAHTTNPVPFVYCSPAGDDGNRQARDGELADVAPTLLDLLEVPPPAEMEGHSLLSGPTRD
jgi:2,3-bisphosphoglycerate-independent phosphoglycerate mutase